MPPLWLTSDGDSPSHQDFPEREALDSQRREEAERRFRQVVYRVPFVDRGTVERLYDLGHARDDQIGDGIAVLAEKLEALGLWLNRHHLTRKRP